MKDFRLVLCRGLRCGVLVASLRVTLLAQSLPSTTVLSANSPSLVLPGSLTLSSIVNQPAVAGGVPTGSVAFTYDNGISLGSAPLKFLPLSQRFPNAPTASTSSLGNNSGGLAAVDLSGNGKPVLVVGNNNFSSAATVSIISNLGGGKFGGPTPTATLQSSSKIDQIASGFFLKQTTRSALVHQPFLYSVISTNTSGVPTVTSSNAGPTSSSADVEFIAIDDFDGDGYSDVGVLLMADDIVGVALNDGGSSAGLFAPLVPAQLPTTPPTGQTGTFCVDGIATGKFQPPFNSELAVLGHFGTCTGAASSNTPSYVVLYAGPTAAPTFTPAGGNPTPFSLLLSDSTPGAIIYYTTDGTAPTTASSVYTAPISVGVGDTTITAMAVAPGDAQSAIISNFYSVPLPGVTGPPTKGRRVFTTRTAVASPKLLTPLTGSNGSTLQAVGTNQKTIASADFNHDGKLDLLVGSGTGSQVTIFYGNGDGTFTPAAAANDIPAIPLILNINDFNGDGYPDVAVTLNGGNGLAVLLNDGTGKLKAATQPYSAGTPLAISSADFNSDGLPDLALLEPSATQGNGSIVSLLSSESGQATLATAPKSLPAGTHTLIASYAGDGNFSASASASLSETVTQTIPTISWATPTPINLTTPPPTLGAGQLDATANVPGTLTYTPPLNTPLVLGPNILGVMFVPTDAFDYADAAAQVTQQVNLPAASVTVAIQPGSDPSQPSIDITFQPFPEPVIMTITLGFTDNSSNPAANNGSIKFVQVPQGDEVTATSGQPPFDKFMVAAYSPATLAPRVFSIGNVAGTVTVAVQLALQDHTNITPAALVPPAVPVAPTVPLIQNATYRISGSTLTVVVVASSTTRAISAADFHFTPVAGKTLTTPDLNMTSIPAFQQWFTNSDSAGSGGGFTYTQPFTVSTDADIIGGVTVMLENGQGQSAPFAAQRSN